MTRLILKILALLFALITLWFIIQDMRYESAETLLFGQIWFSYAPSSLQVAEAVVERYLDPCSLIQALGCAPFLWHPGFATILQSPASLPFGILAVVFFVLSGFAGGASRLKQSNLHKEGR